MLSEIARFLQEKDVAAPGGGFASSVGRSVKVVYDATGAGVKEGDRELVIGA